MQSSLFRFKNLVAHDNLRHFVSKRKHGSMVERESLKKLSKKLNIPLAKFVFVKQVHGDRVVVVKSDYSTQEGDAMVTKEAGLCLTVRVADCVPILLYDPKQQAIGAIHAGWRGTLKHVAEKTIMRMIDHFNTNPENIIAGIGPSIGPCCYELDLWQANIDQLINAGVLPENIEHPRICTKCNQDKFFSYHGSRGSGKMLSAGIMLGG